jgi:hypothetical protein
MMTGKQLQWEHSVHGTGEAFLRGTSASCAGCHSGGAFSQRIAEGHTFAEVENGDPNPTRQDCRACHQIHTSYTGDDWALENTDPVTFVALPEFTFDGGDGNLCSSCHQPRRAFPEAVDGMVDVNSVHWGTHYSVQGAMLFGQSGSMTAVELDLNPTIHSTIENTCVGCHMGENFNHTFVPSVDFCIQCHDDAESLDVNGGITEVETALAELGEALIAAGLLDEEGHLVVGLYPETQAAALWNWIVITEDGSGGVHNPHYALALIEYSMEQLGQ